MRRSSRVFLGVSLITGLFIQPFLRAAMAGDADPVVLAAGAVGGGYFLLGAGICGQFNAASGEPRCAVAPSKGALVNLQALGAGRVDLALTQSDWQHHAWAGSVSPFTGDKAIKDLRALMSLTGLPLVLLARPDSAIKGLDDMAGKRIDIGKTGSGRRAAMDDLVAALGWDLGKFKLASELPEADAIKSLCAGQLDVLALTGATPDRSVTMALKSCALVFVPVTGPAVEKLIADKPYYSRVTIQKGNYPGVKADIASVGLRVILVASAKTPEKTAYALVKAAATNLEAIRKLHPGLASIGRADIATAGISVPLHDGAAKYYREAKLIK